MKSPPIGITQLFSTGGWNVLVAIWLSAKGYAERKFFKLKPLEEIANISFIIDFSYL